MRTPLVRLAAYVAPVALVAAGTQLALSPARAATYDPAPAQNAADWLQGQLTNGLMHNPNYGGFDDYGLSIDTAFGLSAVGGHASTVHSIANAVAAHLGDYIGTGSELYSGATAKTAVLAEIDGDDPTSFGGSNLVQKLESTVSTNARYPGRLEDQSSYGDYANTLGQALGARALAAVSSPDAASVRTFLLHQQCSSGYFRLNFSAKTATSQSCVEGKDAPDFDATAYAVLQLAPQSGDATVAAALGRARAWLVRQQRCDGSFGGGTTTTGSNSNSTGLAAWALGDSPAARQAAHWLEGYQVSQTAAAPLAGAHGAVAYDAAGLAKGRAAGITDATSDQWRRATAQAAPGLAYASSDPTPAVRVTAPTGYVKAGSSTVLRVTGAAAGTVVCATGPGTSYRAIAGASGVNVPVAVPSGTATRSYTVTDAYGHRATTALKVLGATTLKLTRTAYRVHRGHRTKVTIGHLAPGESTTLYYRHRLVARGTAGPGGRFAATFDVGRARGRQPVVAYGQFGAIRDGRTHIVVVR